MNLLPFTAIVVGSLLAGFGFARGKRSRKGDDLDDPFEKAYGAMGTTTAQILGHVGTTDAFTVLSALVWRIGQKADARGARALTGTERRLLAVDRLARDVSNGGFDQYFFNLEGADAGVALAGLRAMGAKRAAAVLKRAMAVFPGGRPSAAFMVRWDVMERIEAKSAPVWEKCNWEFFGIWRLGERITDLSLAYAMRRRTDIRLP